MPMYTCSVCGETASSKCVKSRNVFAEDQIASIIRMIMCVHRPEGYADGKFEAKIDFYVEADETMAQALARQLQMLVRNKESLEKALCEHKWQMQADVCELGCCHKH